MKRFATGAVVVALVFSLLLAGCGSRPAQQEKVLRVGIVNDPATFDIDRTTWIEDPFFVLYDYGLVAIDFDGKLVPSMAESWEVSPDGKVITFKLKSGLKFHDGTKLDAEAVKFRLERMRDDPKGLNREMVSSIADIKVLDERTVQLTCSQVDVSLWTTFAQTFASFMSPEAIKKFGEDYGQHPVGAGPFKFVSHTRGSEIVFEKNPDYKWAPPFYKNQGAPKVDKLVFRIIPDEATRILELEKGNIDLLLTVPPQQVAKLKENKDIQLVEYPENGIRYFGFNCQKWPFDDVRVRQAMNLAIDRDEIARVGYDGLATPVYTALPHHLPGHSKALEEQAKSEYGYNLERAKQVLAEAGWKDTNGDGIVEKDGKALEFSLWITNDPVDQRVAQLIQKQVAAVGAKLDIQVMEEAAIRDGTPKGLHQSILWQYGWSDPDILYFLFHKESGRVRMHWGTDELDELLVKGRTTVDAAERAQYYEQAQRLILDGAPWVPLVVRKGFVAARTWVKDLRFNPFVGILYSDISLEK
ncbi:MAG: ABC transporter substrate-binding protein [Bacillota bacterium]